MFKKKFTKSLSISIISLLLIIIISQYSLSYNQFKQKTQLHYNIFLRSFYYNFQNEIKDIPDIVPIPPAYKEDKHNIIPIPPAYKENEYKLIPIPSKKSKQIAPLPFLNKQGYFYNKINTHFI
ncbi:MAG: hypothetical protein ACOCQR_02005 [bacterium]